MSEGRSGAVPERHLPNLVLAGVTKAGTTSLFSYLAQHPEVFVPVAKELNHFSPAVHGRPVPGLESYARHYLSAGPQRWRVDASPFYFVGGRPVAELVAATLARPRVLIVLREPVARLWSSYTYKASKGVPEAAGGFAAYVDRCREHVADRSDLRAENSEFLTLRFGRYAEFLPGWMDTFGDDLLVLFAEDLARDPARVMARVFGWLGIDPEVADRLDYGRRNVTASPRSVAMHRYAARANISLKPVFARLPWLRRPLHRAYQRFNTTVAREHLTPADRLRAEEFYAESVVALDDLLRSRGYAETPDWVRGPRSRD